MARQEQPIINPKGLYPLTLPPPANSLDFIFTAADVANFDQFALTGRELLLVSSTGSNTFTLESVADDLGRLGDITTYGLATGLFSCFWYGNKKGWEQSLSKAFLKGSAATVKFAVIRIPG
jgi:hypothetical protein